MSQSPLVSANPLDHTLDRQVDELLAQLTLREKVSLLSGRDSWHTVPIERLGLSSLVMTDGPHGVRVSPADHERVQGTATSFPTGVSIASSWDPDLIYQVGAALADETRALGCDILLGPCVNIVRTPLAGRNFESYSEDPYLAGQIGTAWVKGLQSRNIGASLKHYACNNQEIERMRGSTEIDERTLREIYLPAFETIVKEADPWTVMCAYNRINGVYASQHDHLLNEILKDEWEYDGVVISDWGANHTTVESVQGGLDIEMPGPSKWYGRLLQEAVQTWQIDEETIDAAVRRILRMVLGAQETPPLQIPAGAVNTPKHQALARELAEASMVLLKNEGNVLPLDAKAIRSIAIIGPNAAEARIGGGGSSYLEPPYRVSPLEGLRTLLSDQVSIEYAPGCDNWVELPVLPSSLLTPSQGEGSGLWGEFFDNIDLAGEPAATRLDPKLDFWWVRTPRGVPNNAFSARWTGKLQVPTSGRHAFDLVTSGTCRLFLNGIEIASAAPAPNEAVDWAVSSDQIYIELTAGIEYDLQVEYVKPEQAERSVLYLRFAYAPEPDTRLEQAVELAKRSDVAIICAGMAQGFESEGRDRPHMKLPGGQDALIRAVATVNKNTVVVLNCGSPVEMPWIDEVAAVLLAYYPGQEGGSALANILFGHVNPSGKLTVTFPVRYEDNPTYTNYPGTRTVRYGEGIFVGYRYYDHKDVDPLFAFGHGLSYTTFQYTDLAVAETARMDEPVEVSVTVRNSGEYAGKETVQLYVRDVHASLVRPVRELKGFAKVALQPGEATTIQFDLDRRSFSFYDPDQEDWVVEPGEFEIMVGSSSRDIRAATTIALTA